MMLRRSAGKRIRMDDPPPPEFESPATPGDAEGQGSTYSDQSRMESTNDGDRSVSYSASNASDDTYSPNVSTRPRRSKRAAQAMTQAPGSETPARNTRRGGRQAAAAAVEAPVLSPSEDSAPPRKRGRTAGRKSSSVPSVAPPEPTEDEDSLYNAILSSKVSLQQLVDDWIEEYKTNRDATILVLMQFFISSAGCKGKITAEMQNSMEHAAIIRKMTEEFDEESGEYPLVMSGIQWKKFRSNFCDFVQTLVKQCQYSIIYDQHLMDNVISLLTGLSDSQVRAFRHTATLAAMKLMTALVDVALTVSINLDNTQRQYEAERQKGTGKRATDRLESLMVKRQELEENMDEIKNVLTYMFKSVFVHRYRDTLPEIRSICMSEIGIWMKKFHQNFLDDSYLKYIGWTLHDKVGEVRLKCIQALQPLYASEELKGKLELFTSKFKDRIVAMTLDKDYEVAVQAVKLVISIHKYHREILSDKDCELVYELVYSSQRAVAQAAGEFLNERLFVLDEGAVENVRTLHGKQRLPNTPLIRDLVQFFIESELHEHGAYLVDSLIESNPMIKDWECMTDLLLEDPGPSEEALDDKQETCLIEIMVCAVKQCATGEAPIGRGPARKILSAKELKAVSDDKTRLTEHFIPTLPALISKYKDDGEKIVNLLTLPQYFDLEIYTTSRQERSLDHLLKLIGEIAVSHHDLEVLEVTAKSLEIICCDDARKSSRTEVALMSVLDTIWAKANSAIDTYEEATKDGGEANEDELYGLKLGLQMVAVFSGCHSFAKWDAWDKLFQIIHKTTSEGKFYRYPEESVKSVIAACYFALLWDLKNIQEKGEVSATVRIEVENLAAKITAYMNEMKELLVNSESLLFREEAYTSICDALVVFCDQLATTSWMEPLVYRANSALQDELSSFMQSQVFTDEKEPEDEGGIERLHKRRNFLAQYCKLVVYNILPTKAAADVFKHYVGHYQDYGDIIKATLGKAREINKVNCSLTMVLSLKKVFKELPRTDNGWMVDRQAEDFVALKDLAKRFALSFGLDAVKNREAITALHREGILFSVNPLENQWDPTGPPPNLDFLEILAEFTNKLLKQDKRVVLQYLDHRVASATPSSQGSHWQPLYTYRNSLMHGESDHPMVTAKRAYARKRHAAEDEEVVEDEDDADDME